MPKTKAENRRDVMAILLDEEPNFHAPTNITKTLFIDELIPYADHPFKLYEGDRLDDMVRSIKELGVIVPIIVRQLDEDYEILSGHNRVNAAKIAGLKKVPVIIKKGLTDEEAKLIVTETNLIQRSFADLSHSERAAALKQHLEAIKSQGKQNNLLDEIKRLSNPYEIEENDSCGLIDHRTKSRDKTAEKYGLNPRSVTRYTRLCELNKALLNRVDDDEIGLYPAVSISYLSSDEQNELENLLSEFTYKIDMKKAEILRNFSESKKLTNEKMKQILSGEFNRKAKPKIPPPLKIKHNIYSQFFNSKIKQKEMEVIVEQALKVYFTNHKISKGEESS
jgi:ParB family chromosome partitioning protein